jgi:NitT/TauT family transport system permease protein
MKKVKIPLWLKKTVGALFWVVLWWIISLLINKELIMPSPRQTVNALLVLMADFEFWIAAAWSMLRILCGFTLAAVAGTLGGILADRCESFDWLSSPLLHLIRSVPVASFIILAYVWFDTPILPIFIAFLMVVPLFWGNIRAGMKQTDRLQLEMGKVLGLSRRRIWSKIRIPALLPYFRSACVTGLGFAWKSGIAAEVICRPDHSLGDLLQVSKSQFESPAVFALTIVIALLSLLLELALHIIWKEEQK